MTTAQPLTVTVSEEPALVAYRELVAAYKVSYLFVTNRPLTYPRGLSRIAYIGTTYTGFWRLASSTAERARKILRRQHGVTSFEVIPVRAQPRGPLRTWELLEKSLLHVFRERYGSLPRCNKRGGTLSTFFAKADLISVLKQFEQFE